MQNLRTNLAKAKGLGSAKTGTHHWWHQRLTAVIMVFFTIWLLMFIKCSCNKDLSTFITIIQRPYNIVPLGIIVVVSLYHGMLGMQVIIEDYISCLALRFSFIVLLQIFCLITIIAFIVALFYMMTNI
ncbi:succinate dehydrogenase cytochrome b556 small membrane subunit [Candidatus Trichorickettsia mobilis]|uniref:Succinate dehydrogenase hydrophobic membrane anchor subunit n=1 Tax=Candidatus Trichorickettsia mobilis TaxID=1346319 RepID=A0ABZ0UVX3_9RICK|nr:succinate dehydrogenase, hydrophobic membrane anchor protein [Candidatus Trichorickettsia mobilis]WPY00179.1 succinate dehydrogenase cytochrome b556 small membrane subunit [Candidatus Trichorickettsia mobilis]